MSDYGSADSFELLITPCSDDYHSDDDRWRDQVAGLVEELQETADVLHVGRTLPGAKGTIDEMIVALGSAGAFTAAVETFRAWLGRDRGRHIDVRWDEDGATRFVTLTGAEVDVESVRAIAQAAARRVGGPPWPPTTERS